MRQRTFAASTWQLVSLVCWLCLPAGTATTWAQTCTQARQLDFYEQQHYVVSEVEVKSPLGVLTAVRRNLAAAKQKLPLQPGQPFSQRAYNDGMEILRAELATFDNELHPRSRVNAVYPKIHSCAETATPPSLKVVYWLFTSNVDAYLINSLEFSSAAIERHATAAATAQTDGSFAVKPLVGYNRTKQLFGGAQVEARTPGGIFERLRLAATGSPAANEQTLELAGSRALARRLLHQLDYRFGYHRSDEPALTNRLRAGELYAQLTGATQPFGKQQLSLRYGAALAGGNQQTDLLAAANAANSSAASGYGQLKAYVGVTASQRNSGFAASYGLQAGTRGATAQVDFVKHLVDAGYNRRWFFPDSAGRLFHRSFNLESRFNGGGIQRLGRLPVAARFFGGNTTPNFLAGDDWRILSGPVIRSIPQNRLSATSALGDIGATGFYSVNLTASLTVWGRAIIPTELSTDLEFQQKLAGELASMRKVLVAARLKNYPPMKKLVEQVGPLEAEAQALSDLVAKLPPESLEEVPEDLEEASGALAVSLELLLKIHLADKENLPSKMLDMLNFVGTVVTEAATLRDALRTAGLNELSVQVEKAHQTLSREQAQLTTQFNQIDQRPLEKMAEDDTRLLTTVLNSFMHEINLFAVSPVVVFDVARIWPSRSGMRYGIGGGVRLNLVNFNVTLGYAVNPNPKPREGRGAFFFSMDLTDLLR